MPTLSRRRFLKTGLAAAAGCAWGCGGTSETDLCVVGSGFAATYLALATSAAGLSTLLVEAGTADLDLPRDFDYTLSGPIEYEMNRSRVIGVGGTSQHWTGQVNRLRPTDFRVRSGFGLDVDWPLSYDELEPYYCRAEHALSTTGPAALADAEPPRQCAYPFETPERYVGPVVDFEDRALSFFPVAQSRSGGRGGPVRLSRVEIPRLLESKNATLLSGREVVRLVTLDGKRIDHAVARGSTGREERIRARRFVVAAGVVESARLLLRSRSPHFPDGLGNTHDLAGRFFIEHPNLFWRFRVADSRHRVPGLHRTYDLNDRFRAEGLSACHLQVEANPIDDWVVWKLQPELEPRAENRVSLGASGLPDLHFGYSSRDRLTLDHGRAWVERQVERLALSNEVERAEGWRAHPAGTCRMGFDPTNGVVDRDHRVFGLDNLFVSGAAVFPTTGTSNPTLTVVALTLRLAERLVAEG